MPHSWRTSTKNEMCLGSHSLPIRQQHLTGQIASLSRTLSTDKAHDKDHDGNWVAGTARFVLICGAWPAQGRAATAGSNL